MLGQISRLFKYLDAETIEAIDDMVTAALKTGKATQGDDDTEFIEHVQELSATGTLNSCLVNGRR